MRIVALDGRMLRHDRAGIGRYIWRLQEALAALPRQDMDLALLVDRRGGLPGKPALRARAVLAPVRGRPERILLPHALRGADLAHFPDHGIPDGCTCPAVVTVHDISFLTHPETHSASSRRYYERAIQTLRRARAVIVLSKHARAALVGRGLAEAAQVTVIPNAPGLPAPGPGLRSRAWPAPYALMVGTIQPRKNIALAARAYAAAAFARQAPLLIAGSIGYRGPEIVRAVQDEHGAGSVRFLGRVSDDMLVRLLAQAEFLLMPSLDEGFGLPAVEAMSCGTPVIAARAGPVPEVVGDAAVLIEPDDREALTAAIDRLGDDAELRAALGARGRARSAAFSWERTARATLAVYEAHA